jgi:DnaJ-class molecular chaperone
MTEISEYHKRKQTRKEFYLKYIHGNKLVPCTACNGSGHYDSFNSPKCGACNGTGKQPERTVPFNNC